MRLLLLGAVVVLSGCASFSTRPLSEADAFPAYGADPRLGLILNAGTAHVRVAIYDEHRRLVSDMFVAGANRFTRVNGRAVPKGFAGRLPVGQYRIEVYPFFYRFSLASFLFGRGARKRIDLPRQEGSLTVDRDPMDHYFGGRHWGWILWLNGGNIPDAPHDMVPGARVNFVGRF